MGAGEPGGSVWGYFIASCSGGDATPNRKADDPQSFLEVFQAMAVGCLPSHTGPESLGMTVCLRPYWLPEHKRQITHRAERVTQCMVHSSCGRKKMSL